MSDARRHLPAVGTLLESAGVRELARRAPRDLVADAVRRSIEAARRDPAGVPADDAGWLAAITAQVDAALVRSLRPVINGTGVILHTNLGRAPLAQRALDAVRDVASGYSNLEYDLGAGQRGSRHQHCASLLCELTGAEDAMVANNCAAALVLALNTLADGREAVISRGELVEIGGSFRVPAIMAKSGATLVEVGTTNRTHAQDYAAAITPRTGAIVAVHRSNFVQEGFVASVKPAELAAIADRAGVALIHDFGSGLLADLSAWGLRGEPTAKDAVGAGASVVVMSGDKLLGGPQAGIVLGRSTALSAMRANPLARALRVDKMTLAALEATLELYRDPAAAIREIPVLRMLTAPLDSVRTRAAAVVRLAGSPKELRVVDAEATVGGGAFPAARIPSAAIRVGGISAADAESRLRAARVPVIGRVIDDALCVDLRSIPEIHDELVAASLAGAVTR
jgi:L-seryl-tRNA(Ser) seleniumtransferase